DYYCSSYAGTNTGFF
nr:immunoglobulin light chain junction region [Macaca mulatta]MOX75833.1 immunoglobulin light chain junction region [Macaca mulatta]MOX77520.1 immunoglobulin light chain junction region [Macaca mulatta]MOX77532.1 immunoglobulin light chain junction region [Macaca mulatta]MOX77833.1 immunoglobulin light chain junction region [Macaca mulatta]